MEKRLPTLIFGRLAKADRMIFEPVPLDEKHVLIGIVDASLQLMRSIPGSGANAQYARANATEGTARPHLEFRR
jgi:hypothetical protein